MPENASLDNMLVDNAQEMGLTLTSYVKLFRMAVAETRADMAVLEKSIEAGDFVHIQAISHRLKGTCANVHLPMLAVPAGEINALAKKAEDIGQVRDFFLQLKKSFETLQGMTGTGSVQ